MKIKDILSIQLDNDIKNVIDLNLQSEYEGNGCLAQWFLWFG